MTAKELPPVAKEFAKLATPQRQVEDVGRFQPLRDIALKNAPKGAGREQQVEALAGFLKDVTTDPKLAKAFGEWCGNVIKANQLLGQLLKATGHEPRGGIRTVIESELHAADTYYDRFGLGVGWYKDNFVMEPPSIMLAPADCVMTKDKVPSRAGYVFDLALVLKEPGNPSSGVALHSCYEPCAEVRSRAKGWDGIYAGSVPVDPSNKEQLTAVAAKMVDLFGERATPKRLAEAAIRHVVNEVDMRFGTIQYAIQHPRD